MNWEIDEPHFGCHKWTIEIYNWDGEKFSIIERKSSKKMFALDKFDSLGQCEVVSTKSLQESLGY